MNNPPEVSKCFLFCLENLLKMNHGKNNPKCVIQLSFLCLECVRLPEKEQRIFALFTCTIKNNNNKFKRNGR